MTARLLAGLERRTGYAGWAVVGAVSGLGLMGIAMVGLYWDVAWHVDLGRDKQVLTPPHLLILTSLTGLMFVAGLTIWAATASQADVGLRWGRWRLPWSAVLLAAFRIGGIGAFVLDALWHQAYGVDVTLLSPPHLGLLISGSLSAISLWLMLAEGRTTGGPTRLGRALHLVTLASVLIGFSTYQAEYDFGVPLYPVLLLPVLLMTAAGLALTTARLALGRGGALATVAGFSMLRLTLAPLLGGLGHVMPRLPFYLAAALAVEVAAWRFGTRNRLRFALTSGVLLATVGLAGEWAWAATFGHHHLAPANLPLAMALGAGAAIAASILGTALAGSRLPTAALLGAGAVLLVAVAIPVQRQVGQVDAVVAIDRLEGDALVTVELRPADAARQADLFQVWSVQGDGRIQAPLRPVAPGRYQADRPVPVGGEWKTVVALYRGREVMAIPIRLPADPEIGAAEVPAQRVREGAFTSMGAVLLREGHDGPAWAAVVAYTGLAALMAVWLLLLSRSQTLFRPRPSAVLDHLGGAR